MDAKNFNHMPQVLRQLKAMSSKLVQVGVMGDGETRTDSLSNAELGAVHEYGTEDGSIPARHWLSRPINQHQAAYVEALGKLVKQSIEHGTDPERALTLLGLRAEADVKNFLRAGGAQPPNSPATIERKGSSTPLIDSGQLLGSVTSRVVEASGVGE